MSDGDLAALSIVGRHAAFAEIMRRYRQPVFRMVRTLVGDTDEALDLVQETFVSAHRALSRYDPGRAMKAWRAPIAVNKCRDWARKHAVRRFLSFARPLDALAEAVPGDQAPIEDSEADRQGLARVTHAIAALPEKLKATLVLRTIEGMSQAETAEILGISPKAVETRLYRARLRLVGNLRQS